MEKMGKNSFDPDFKTPLSEPKAGKDVGPDVFNAPVMAPRDPLGLVTDLGGSSKGSILGKK